MMPPAADPRNPIRPASRFADVNGVRLHYVEAGAGRPILFLHGFPEFWYAWKHQLDHFAPDHRVIALDQRGYHLSDKPEAVSAYALPVLVEDVRALLDHLGLQKVTLVGHDWGGVVAWAFAMAHAERLDRLVIINAPHPAVFRRELASNPAQQEASRYIGIFRTPQAESLLLANDCAALERIVLADGVAKGYFTPEDRAEYLAAWTQPGAITGGLNWYRAMGAALPGEYIFATPVLVIWGMKDTALLPGNLDGLDQWVARLHVERVPEADHWIVHQCPELVNRLIREFLAAGV
jgi:pimeloyl-ACP methyl ester carboxylesterase